MFAPIFALNVNEKKITWSGLELPSINLCASSQPREMAQMTHTHSFTKIFKQKIKTLFKILFPVSWLTTGQMWGRVFTIPRVAELNWTSSDSGSDGRGTQNRTMGNLERPGRHLFKELQQKFLGQAGIGSLTSRNTFIINLSFNHQKY